MADATLILSYLRRIDSRIDGMMRDMADLKTRMEWTETSLADIHGQLAEHSVRFDRMAARLDRIERRLELQDSPAPS